MKKTAIIIACAVVLASATPAFAQETTLITDSSSAVMLTYDPAFEMNQELADLKTKELDPAIGSFTKLIIRFKIRQIENQLNIMKALQ